MARSQSTTSLTKKQETSSKWVGRRPDPSKYFGFVYQVTNLKTGRKYIGRKFYWSKAVRRKWVVKDMTSDKWDWEHWKPSNWKTYNTSSTAVKADISKYGKDNFEFRILHQWKSSRAVQYMEVKTQWQRKVLESDDYYNGRTEAIQFPCPEECK